MNFIPISTPWCDQLSSTNDISISIYRHDAHHVLGFDSEILVSNIYDFLVLENFCELLLIYRRKIPLPTFSPRKSPLWNRVYFYFYLWKMKMHAKAIFSRPHDCSRVQEAHFHAPFFAKFKSLPYTFQILTKGGGGIGVVGRWRGEGNSVFRC